MNLRSIRDRLRLAAVGLGIVLLGTASLAWWTIQRLAGDIEARVEAAAENQRLTNRFTFDVADELRAAQAYLLDRDSRQQREFVARGRDAHRAQSALVRAQLAGRAQDGGTEAELVARIDTELSGLEADYARAHRLADLGAVEEARAAVEPTRTVQQALRRDISLLAAQRASRVAQFGNSVRATAVGRSRLVMALLLGAVLLVVVLAWGVGHGVAHHLETLVAHAHALRRGARDTRTSTTGLPTEVRLLAEAMNQASDSLASLARTEAALHHAEKLAAIGTLISGVAHELNNPLQVILLLAEELDAAATTDSARADASAIVEQVTRARTIIGDLLATVRPDNAARDLAPLEAVLAAAQHELTIVTRRHGAEFDCTIEAGLPPILVDRVGLVQVLTNLVANGAAAAGSAGRVYARAARTAGGCDITIDDTGPGIRPDFLSRIFEPFFSTKAVGQGTGLGLSVSRGLIESMRGTLTAESHWGGPRTGARFRISFPAGLSACAARPGQADPDPDSGSPPADAGARTLPASRTSNRCDEPVRPAAVALPVAAEEGDATRRMLLVDDEPAILAVLERFFTRRGWLVDQSHDGTQALERIEARYASGECYDVVFCDIRMPTMSGIELHDILNDRHAGLLDRVIFLSGDFVSADVRQFIERTACRIFAKPLDIVRLDEAANHSTQFRSFDHASA